MDAQEFYSLSEAYNQVHQLDEVLDTPEKANEYGKKAVGSMLGAAAKAIVSKKLNNPEMYEKHVKTIEKRTKGVKMAKRKAEKKAAEEAKESYDIIISHLLDEGYASTSEAADKIILNMSESWFEEIMEARRMDKEGANREDSRRAERAEKAKESLAKAQRQKKIFQKFHDKETAAGRTPRSSRDTLTIPEREHKKNFPGSRQEPKEKGSKESDTETRNRRVSRHNERVMKHGFTSKEKKEGEAMSKYTSRFD